MHEAFLHSLVSSGSATVQVQQHGYLQFIHDYLQRGLPTQAVSLALACKEPHTHTHTHAYTHTHTNIHTLPSPYLVHITEITQSESKQPQHPTWNTKIQLKEDTIYEPDKLLEHSGVFTPIGSYMG